jgi:pimeloyl-ACP methyl ester carboxylesterase
MSPGRGSFGGATGYVRRPVGTAQGGERWAEDRPVAPASNSKFVLDPSSGHAIQIDNPQLVARAIEEVVAAASKGVHLAP